MAIIVELILTTEKTGEGTEKSPVRLIQQLYSKSGKLVAYKDPINGDGDFYYQNLDEKLMN